MREPFGKKDYYAILGVDMNSTSGEIKTAFRKKVKEYHPDKFGTYPQKAWATKKTIELIEAYEVLENPSRRLEYNREYCGPIDFPDKSKFERWWKRYCGYVFGIPWAIGLIYFLDLFQVENFNADRIFHSLYRIITKFFGAALASGFVLMSLAMTIGFYVALPIYAIRDYWKRLKSSSTPSITDRLKFHFGIFAIMGGLFFLSYFLVDFSLDNSNKEKLEFFEEILAGGGVLVGAIGINVFWVFIFAIPLILMELIAMMAVLLWSKKVIKKTQALVVVGSGLC